MQGQESVLYFQPRSATPSERLFNAAHLERNRRIADAARRRVAVTEPPLKSGAELIEEWRECRDDIPLPVLPDQADDAALAPEPDTDPEPLPAFPTVLKIQLSVAKFYGVNFSELLSIRRTAQVVRRRQIAMFLSRTLTKRSMPEIGRRFGGMDHTTILHAIRKIEALIAKDPAIAAEVEAIKATIPGPFRSTPAMPVE